MMTIALAALLATAGLFSLGVLAHSYARGFAALAETRRALAACEETTVVRLKIVEHKLHEAPMRLRLVSSSAPRALPRPALRAAA